MPINCGSRVTTNPDYLLERDRHRIVVESRGFQSWAISEHLDRLGGGGLVPRAITHRAIFSAIKEKARQLRPFAWSGLPLVIALANSGASDVLLDEHHMFGALFADLMISVPIPMTPAAYQRELPLPHIGFKPGCGALCAADATGALCNPCSHLSAVIVLHRHDLNQEWKATDLGRFMGEGKLNDVDDDEAHNARLAAWLETSIARGELAGPTGHEYGADVYDFARYALGHGPRLPEDWFAGARDRRFAFDAAGTRFGRVSGTPSRY